MNEYELYTRILAPRLQPIKQDILVENKLGNKHKATILSDRVKNYTLYRYDMDEEKDKFFPFFNGAHGSGLSSAYPIQNDLLRFCDYILLAEKNAKLYVVLIEMKSGTKVDAPKQLEASSVFMKYICDSAKRIANANQYSSFNRANIIEKRIILKPGPKSKPPTNIAKSTVPPMNFNNGGVVSYSSNILPLYQICK